MAGEPNPVKIAAQNRKAHYNYTIEERLEVGIVLNGSEVKSLREGGPPSVNHMLPNNLTNFS